MEAEEPYGEARVLALLGIRLDELINRRVPVRGIHAGPVELSTRLRFADGTTLLVRSEQSGNLARVLRAVQTGRAVLIERWERRPGGLAMSLGMQLDGKRIHLAMLVLGPDQPD